MNNPQEYLWSQKYRPTTTDDYIGNPEFKTDLEQWISEGTIPNIILNGSFGCGKTTAAKLIVGNIPCEYLYINGSDNNSIDTVRSLIKPFASSAGFENLKIIILDESNRLSVEAQNALNNLIETFSQDVRFIFTCNYIDMMTGAIKSRLKRYDLDPPTKQEIAQRCKYILDQEKVTYKIEDIAKLVNDYYPDNRQTIIQLQSASSTGELTLTNSLSDVSRVSDELILNLKQKNLNKIRKIVIDLQLRDYTELYTLLSDRLYDYTDNVIIPWYIAESSFHSISAPNKQITFLGLISRIINEI